MNFIKILKKKREKRNFVNTALILQDFALNIKNIDNESELNNLIYLISLKYNVKKK